jgi:hypothetical protein
MDDREAERLGRLVETLGQSREYAIGARRFPGRVHDQDAADIVAALAEEVDAGCAARADAATAAGYTIACKSGCTSCCEVLVLVWSPEAIAIARWLAAPERAEERARFLAAYETWRAGVGDLPERVSERFVARDTQGYDAIMLDAWRRRVLCAFNHEGRCEIYPVRPLGCRNAHALDTADRCTADRAPAAALEFVPLDRLMQSATQLLRAAHNAAGGERPVERHRIESVCEAVHRLLLE